jgi:hypothetical protein
VRDDFDSNTKITLAKRVGFHCSNPKCQKLTSGPHEDPTKSVNIGVAAHISAASPGGKRYDAEMSSEARKCIDNGMWLCQNCAKLIDSDEKKYSVDLLKDWKSTSEQSACREVENSVASTRAVQDEDTELIRFYSQCFDRPAFQDPFHEEGSMEAFDKAIEDTITAINTGCLRARDGGVLTQSRGKSYISNKQWRKKMDEVVDLLRDIRCKYLRAIRKGQIHVGPEYEGRRFYHIRDHEIGRWMDSKRSDVIQLFSELCQEAGVPTLQFPRKFG